MVKKIVEIILDFVFPVFCLGCGKEGNWLCHNCLVKIPFYQKQCPWCEKLVSFTTLCPDCQKISHLDSLLVVTSYQNSLIQDFIHNLKYNFAWKIAKDLKPLLIKFFNEPFFKQKNYLAKRQPLFLIPIPLHRKRLLERGFNQSEVLAKITAEVLKARVLPNILIRKRNTISQMTLSRKERLINIKDVFQCLDPKSIKGRSIMIIDDVLTTGATISEAALALKKAGCRSIGALVLAKDELIFKQKNVRLN